MNRVCVLPRAACASRSWRCWARQCTTAWRPPPRRAERCRWARHSTAACSRATSPHTTWAAPPSWVRQARCQPQPSASKSGELGEARGMRTPALRLQVSNSRRRRAWHQRAGRGHTSLRSWGLPMHPMHPVNPPPCRAAGGDCQVSPRDGAHRAQRDQQPLARRGHALHRPARRGARRRGRAPPRRAHANRPGGEG